MSLVDGVAGTVFGRRMAPVGAGGVAVAAVVGGVAGLSVAGEIPSGRLDGHTVFSIGSISKALTGTLLADFVLRSKVDLDDQLVTFFPELSGTEAASISLRLLATHRSGLPLRPPSSEGQPALTQYDGVTRATVLADLAALPMADRPTAFEYSNFGYAVLGQALERAGGADWGTLVRDRILVPLGMTESVAVSDAGDTPEYAQGVGKLGRVIPHRDASGLVGAGGVYSTAADMLKLLTACLAPPDDQVGRALRLAMSPPARHESASDDGNRRFVALGWRVLEIPSASVRLVWHNGHGPGNHSFFGVLVDEGIGLAALTNHHHSVDFDRDAVNAMIHAARRVRE